MRADVGLRVEVGDDDTAPGAARSGGRRRARCAPAARRTPPAPSAASPASRRCHSSRRPSPCAGWCSLRAGAAAAAARRLRASLYRHRSTIARRLHLLQRRTRPFAAAAAWDCSTPSSCGPPCRRSHPQRHHHASDFAQNCGWGRIRSCMPPKTKTPRNTSGCCAANERRPLVCHTMSSTVPYFAQIRPAARPLPASRAACAPGPRRSPAACRSPPVSTAIWRCAAASGSARCRAGRLLVGARRADQHFLQLEIVGGEFGAHLLAREALDVAALLQQLDQRLGLARCS